MLICFHLEILSSGFLSLGFFHGALFYRQPKKESVCGLASKIQDELLSKNEKTSLSWVAFCLQPSAKDQGITWVVVLVLVVLPRRDLNLGPPDPQSGTIPTELRRQCYLSVLKSSTYFKIQAADLGPVLVDTCLIRLFLIWLRNWTKIKRAWVRIPVIFSPNASPLSKPPRIASQLWNTLKGKRVIPHNMILIFSVLSVL